MYHSVGYPGFYHNYCISSCAFQMWQIWWKHRSPIWNGQLRNIQKLYSLILKIIGILMEGGEGNAGYFFKRNMWRSFEYIESHREKPCYEWSFRPSSKLLSTILPRPTHIVPLWIRSEKLSHRFDIFSRRQIFVHVMSKIWAVHELSRHVRGRFIIIFMWRSPAVSTLWSGWEISSKPEQRTRSTGDS